MIPSNNAEPKPATTNESPAPPPSTVPATRERNPIAVQMGVAPTTIDEAWRLSQYLANSELVPKNYRGKPADVLVAIQMSMELGLPPMSGLQSIAVVNGRATLWGDGLLAVIIASPLYETHDEYFEVDGKRVAGLTAEDWKKDTTCAVCTFTRHNKPEPVVSRFTVGQAKKAQLLGKDGPWQTYPDRMLKMRARGFAARDAFPDLMRGIKSAEEIYDTPDDPPAVVREVRRVSDTRDLSSFGVDRTPDTRHDDSVVIGPVAVLDVEPFLGVFVIRLADGSTVDTTEPADAAELEKIKGTGTRYRFTCRRVVDGNPVLQSFAAD